MAEDALWYEAANVVGITNALNVVADGLGSAASDALLKPVEEAGAPRDVQALFADIRAFYSCREIPAPFTFMALEPGYAMEVWAAVKRAFGDNRLSRRLKEGLAFAVSLTSRSAFGTAFHLAEVRRLGVGERGLGVGAGRSAR